MRKKMMDEINKPVQKHFIDSQNHMYTWMPPKAKCFREWETAQILADNRIRKKYLLLIWKRLVITRCRLEHWQKIVLLLLYSVAVCHFLHVNRGSRRKHRVVGEFWSTSIEDITESKAGDDKVNNIKPSLANALPSKSAPLINVLKSKMKKNKIKYNNKKKNYPYNWMRVAIFFKVTNQYSFYIYLSLSKYKTIWLAGPSSAGDWEEERSQGEQGGWEKGYHWHAYQPLMHAHTLSRLLLLNGWKERKYC